MGDAISFPHMRRVILFDPSFIHLRYTYKWFSRYKKAIFLQAYSLLDKVGNTGLRSKERKKTDTSEPDPKSKKDVSKEKKENVDPRPVSEPNPTVREEPATTYSDDPNNANSEEEVRTPLVDLRDEGVYAALLVSLMVQRKVSTWHVFEGLFLLYTPII